MSLKSRGKAQNRVEVQPEIGVILKIDVGLKNRGNCFKKNLDLNVGVSLKRRGKPKK